ncbi:MAG: hypothetical protein DVB31_01955 [Verrucomicrobia bacterium]|nr:MAG: hypothetical protein DVB31_01955 [Verrucomicrobiota bacterium]
MSTIAPGRLFNVTDAASFVALSQQNWVIASEELFRRLATYQNGTSNTLNGPPTTGTWSVGDFWRDQKGAEFVCTGAGTPGTWRQITPATVTADPASGTFPTGYLIVNVTDGGLKRHAGSLSWEIQVGAGTAAKVGFHGATPVGQRANTDQAVATDLASVIVLANELRAALVEKGLIKGGA